MGSCNITQTIANKIIGTSDSPSGLVNCEEQTSSDFKSYKPFTGNVSQFADIGGKTQGSATGFLSGLDGSCCYILNDPDNETTKCSDFSFNNESLDMSINLQQVNTVLTISNSSEVNGYSVSVCGVTATSVNPIALGKKASSALSSLKSETGDISDEAGKEGGIKGLVLLVIAGLLSTLVYVIFILGPFLFWSKFAPNTIITGENDCNIGRTILDRFYGYDQTKLPYNWKLYDGCRPPKEKPIVLDKCMGEDNVESLQSKIKVGGDAWSKVEFLIRGFPYNLINEKKEKMLECFKGGWLLLVTFFICLAVYGSVRDWTVHVSNFFSELGEIIVVAIIASLSAIVVLMISLYWTKTEGNSGYIIAAFVAFITAVGSFINSMIAESSEMPKTVIAIITAVIVFICIALLASKKSVTGDNYTFGGAISKAMYYIRKCFVTGYRQSSQSSRWAANKTLKFLGKLPLPNWIWVIGGSAILPLVIIVLILFVILCGTWGGFTGFYDYVEYKFKTITKCPQTLSGGSNTEPNDSNGEIEGGGPRFNAVKNFIRKKASSASESIKSSGKGLSSAVKSIGKGESPASKYIGKGLSSTSKSIGTGASMTLSALNKGRSSLFNHLSKTKDKMLSGPNEQIENLGARTDQAGFRGVIAFFLLLIPLIMGFLYGVLNLIFFLLTYFLMPLLYPKIFVNVIACNMKSLTFLFSLGIMSALWTYHNKGTDFVPKTALDWMTVTFVIVTIYNLFVK